MPRPDRPPTRARIEAMFRRAIDGGLPRGAVGHWAVGFLAPDGPDVDDPVVWWALDLLAGVDLRHGPGEPYLHDDVQLSEWLREFRARCEGADLGD